jgi:hypothetical protein
MGGVSRRQSTAASERELHAGGVAGSPAPPRILGRPARNTCQDVRAGENNASHAPRPRAPGARPPEGNPIVSTLTLLVVLLIVGTVAFLGLVQVWVRLTAAVANWWRGWCLVRRVVRTRSGWVRLCL